MLLEKKKGCPLRVLCFLKKSRAKPSGFGATSKKVELNPQGSGCPEKKKGWPLGVLQGGDLCKPSIEKRKGGEGFHTLASGFSVFSS